MVLEAVDVGHLNDPAAGWRLYSPWDRRILVQRKVRAPLVIVIQEESKRASQGPLIPDDDVIKTLSPEGPDQPLHEGILPRRARRDQDFLRAKLCSRRPKSGP